MATTENENSYLDELIRNYMKLRLVREEENVDPILSQQFVPCYNIVRHKSAHSRTKDNSNLYIPDDVYTEINELLKLPINPKDDIRKERKQKRSNKHFNIAYTIELFNIEKEIFTFSKKTKIIIIKSFEFSCVRKQSQWRYCFFCKQKVSDNLQIFYEHIRSFHHIKNLENMISSHQCFDITTEYIEKTNNYWKCFECKILLKYHMEQYIKDKNREKIFLECCKQSEDQCNYLLKELDNYWYNIHCYACVPCNKQFKFKLDFLKHINDLHKNAEDFKYDFCIPCATLWMVHEKEYNVSFSRHCEDLMHQFLINSLNFLIGELPSRAKELLENVEETAENLFKLSETALKSDLIKTKFLNPLESLLSSEFPGLKMYPFGSRIAGLSLPNSDVDILIDCEGNTYECSRYDELSTSSYMDIAKKCLQEDKDFWDVQEILKKTRIPIIRLRHRQTGLSCDLSFSNGLSVENTKLIRSINEACLPCRKLILFIKKWLSCCNLPGQNCIKNYALAWLVIYYLQSEKFLPSINTLIRRSNKSRLIFGWETGIDHEILATVVNKSFDQLLRGFFTFYGNFNYKDYVICPFIADTVEKKDFIDILKLPKAMNLYVEYIQESAKNTGFRIDSAMCIQDPIELSHNLTKAVDPLTLKAFKEYCKLSVNILNNTL